MATCPKCQLPNPEGVAACIWCGRHQFSTATVEEAVAVAAPLVSATVGGEPVLASPGPLVQSIQTPGTPPPAQKPLPSHVNLLLTPRPIGGGSSAEPLTIAATAAARAAQTCTTTPPPAETPAALRPRLLVIRGQKIGAEYPVYEGRNVIGRFADRPVDIDLIVQEAEGQIWSSRHHAAITFENNTLFVEDLNSLNGTWVNGVKLQAGQHRTLKSSDVIQIGTVQLKLVIN